MITAKEIIEYREILRNKVLGEFISEGYKCKVSRHNIYIIKGEGSSDKVMFTYKGRNLWISCGSEYIPFTEVQKAIEIFKRAVDKTTKEDFEVLSL